MTAPGVSNSNEAAGTHEGTCRYTLKGTLLASSIISLNPYSPSTLHISCGSAKMLVVPLGITALENSVSVSMLLSTCTWASIRPGARYLPLAFITKVSLPMVCSASSPTYAILSPFMATSISSSISPEYTSTRMPPFITKSAFSRPKATSMRLPKTSHSLLGKYRSPQE